MLRHHAADSTDPASVLDRHVVRGEPRSIPALLRRAHDGLQSYDEGLRRYPVVYYFHPRHVTRSMPYAFAVCGYLVAALRWGLPGRHPLSEDPWLLALAEQHDSAVERVQRSFVRSGAGPSPPRPLDEEGFLLAYRAGGRDRWVDSFRAMEQRTVRQFSLPAGRSDDGDAYRRYQGWLPFAHRRFDFLTRTARDLGYQAPETLITPPVRGSRPG